MSLTAWLGSNIFDIVSTVGVIGSLWFTSLAFWAEARARRVSNHVQITANHREIWKLCLMLPALDRVSDEKMDLVQFPVTNAELIFVNLVIAHLNTAYYALRSDVTVDVEALRRDVSNFLSLPIPSAVWEKAKPYQNEIGRAHV